MRVGVSCIGTFHAFQLAYQLQQREALSYVVTGYPRFKLRRWQSGVQDNFIHSLPSCGVLGYTVRKIPRANNTVISLIDALASRYFDLRARRLVNSTLDILTIWSGMAASQIKKAHAYGVKTVLERGSSHIQFQCDIYAEEYERLGIHAQPITTKPIIKRELQEYQLTDYISVPSQFVKKTFIEKGVDAKKILVSPYGVDIAAFHHVPKTDDVFRVLFVGGLSVGKGLHLLLEAWHELKLPQAELVLVGGIRNDGIQPFLERYRDDYRYIGKVPHNELYKHYSQASLFVLTSLEEGLSMVIPEAMACGCPVLITVNTGGGEFVTDGGEGFIIRLHDKKTLQEKIVWAYEHQKKAALMGQQAQQTIQKYTWNSYGNRTMKHYEHIIQKSH